MDPPLDLASSVEPCHHPDCCMGISHTLLQTLIDLLPPRPAISVLSIGSGTGLIECLLSQLLDDSVDICGVEVSPNVNKYLAEENMFYVGGTWDLCRQAARSQVWMFVYPRDPQLIVRYLQSYHHHALSKIIWLGPRMDWQDYENVLQSSKFSRLTVLENRGSAKYEMVAVAEPSS